MDIYSAIIALLAGTGTLLIGFKVLSENIEKLATSKLKGLFNKTSKNKFVGVGIGAGTTAIIQSSAATTIMVVGFVNAGVMTLYQATAIIMGANIGTTITAQIVSLKAIDVSQIAMCFTLIGILMSMFCKRDKVKTLGLALGGLGLVFLGLEFMSNAMTDFKNNPGIVDVLEHLSNPFLLLLLGIGITALIQSSSAITSILVSMVGAGIVIGGGGNSILYVILGSNIGTCVTALLSSIGANTNAKRASLIHLLFNVFGSSIFFVLLLCWKDFMNDTFVRLFSQPEVQVAMFHTFFNVTCTLIFIPFIGVFVKVASVLIKDKDTESTRITYIDERILNSPSIAITQITKEISYMSKVAIESLELAMDKFIKKDDSNSQAIFDKINQVDIINKRVIDYLVKISANTLALNDEKKVSSLHHVLGDVIRISEVADNTIKYTSSVIKENLDFSEPVMHSIDDMFFKIKELYEFSMNAFENNDKKLLKNVDSKEDEIDALKKKLINDHIRRLNDGECKPQNSGVFINLVCNLERVADHITYIAHSIEGGI